MLRAVVYLAVMFAGDRYGYSADRIDGQITIGSFRYDVLSSCIYGSYSVISEVCRIRSCLSTRSTDFNCGEVRTLGSAGEAGNGVLLAVISNGIAIGLEFNILIVVECDHICICVGSDRYCLAVSGNRGAAGDSCRFFGNYCVKRLASYYIVCFNRLIRSVPIVVYGVAEVVLDFILCGVGNIFCDGFSNRRIPTCEFIAIVGGNGRCCRSVAAQFYTGCYIAFVILIGKIAVIALVIGNGAFRSRALYAGDVEVIDFTSCGEGGFLVCSIVAVLVKADEIGIKGYCVGQLISISGLAIFGNF